jgi:outer membrane protein assembly factor BamE (lipoprotein component of BamABCDE complex)
MNPFRSSLPLAVLLVLLPGCSTTESRIAGHRASFDQWPPSVQQRVSTGQIDIGFTQEQVRVALGEPDHVFARTAANGSFEVWSYADRGPHFSFGIGMGSFGRHSAYGGGVVVGGPTYPEEKLRVIFDAYGRVSSIEQIRRG